MDYVVFYVALIHLTVCVRHLYKQSLVEKNKMKYFLISWNEELLTDVINSY